jgi:hypothetical protein
MQDKPDGMHRASLPITAQAGHPTQPCQALGAVGQVRPVLPEVKVSALGTDVVVDGRLAEGASLVWNQLTSGPLGHAAQ